MNFSVKELELIMIALEKAIDHCESEDLQIDISLLLRKIERRA